MLAGSGVSRQDRAKMDVWVTSRHRQSPCLEWSKGTDRSSPIQGHGRHVDQANRPRIDPMAPKSHVATIDFKLSRPRDPPYRRADDRPFRALAATPNEFRSGARLPDPELDYLSTNARSTKCAVTMGRGVGSPPTPRGRPRKGKDGDKDADGEKSKRRGRRELDEDDLLQQGGKGDDGDLHRSPSNAPVGDPAPEQKEQKGSPAAGEEPRRRRRERPAAEPEAELQRWPDNTNRFSGGGGTRRGGPGRRWGLDIAKMTGREQFDPKRPRRVLEYNYSPRHNVSSKHQRCRGGDFWRAGRRRSDKSTGGGETYDPHWGSVDPHVMGPRFDRKESGAGARGVPADAYGGRHELLRPLQSKWGGASEKLKGWHERCRSAAGFSPPTGSAPQCRARSPDVGGAIKSADASLEMVRGELGTHRTERRRRKDERVELYREDRYGRLQDVDPASSPGFRYAYAHCDTPPASPGGGGGSATPPRAASAPLGAGSL